MDELERVWGAGLESGALKIPRCTHCGTWNWYPLPGCRSCQRTGFEWMAVGPLGVLYSWTRVHRAFTNFALPVPYVVGLVDMADAPGVRIAARSKTDALPQIGDEVSLTPARDRSGRYWAFERCGSEVPEA